MKRIIILLIFLFTLTGCQEEKLFQNKKVLVVYFSATHTTQKIAQMIKKDTLADIFKVEPVHKYTSSDLSWDNQESRVHLEKKNSTLVPLKTTTVKEWKKYDVVFLGYPIWWGEAAWPVNGFVINNDFKNKIVIPFCTSGSSSIGKSAEHLSQLAKGGQWLNGERFSKETKEKDIKKWLTALIHNYDILK